MNRVGRPKGEKNTRHFLREWREHRKLTQDELASRIENRAGDGSISPTRISKFERGKENLTEGMIYAFAEALSIEPGWLFLSPSVFNLVDRAASKLEKLPEEKREKLAVALAAMIEAA